MLSKILDAKWFKKNFDSTPKKVALKFIEDTPKYHKIFEKKDKELFVACEAIIDELTELVNDHPLRPGEKDKLNKLTKTSAKESEKKKKAKEKLKEMEEDSPKKIVIDDEPREDADDIEIDNFEKNINDDDFEAEVKAIKPKLVNGTIVREKKSEDKKSDETKIDDSTNLMKTHKLLIEEKQNIIINDSTGKLLNISDVALEAGKIKLSVKT